MSAVYEPMNAREAYYRRMARRYRELAAGSADLEMAEGWRAAADECDKLAKAMNASPPESALGAAATDAATATKETSRRNLSYPGPVEEGGRDWRAERWERLGGARVTTRSDQAPSEDRA